MPVDDRMHSHELRPPVIRGIKVRQVGTVWICPPSADEYRFDGRIIPEVLRKRRFHWGGVSSEREIVGFDGRGDKGFDLGERVWSLNVDGLYGTLGVCGGVYGSREAFPMEAAKIEDQKDQAILSAVIGQGDFIQASRLLEAPEMPGLGKLGIASEKRAHLYRSSASDTTSRDILVCACTFLRRSLAGSSSRNAVTLSFRYAHISRNGNGALDSPAEEP